MPDDDDLLDLRSAASALGIHYQTAYRWVRTGRLPARFVDGRYVVRRDDLRQVRTERATPTPPAPPSSRRLARHAREMHEALCDGDETSARRIAHTLTDEGTPIADLIQQVLVPALRRIGQAWHDGELSIWAEHRASAITERILGELAPNPRGRRRGTVAVAALAGDHHSLPTSMAAVTLRQDNWRVHHLGANMPPAELVRFHDAHDIDVTVLTVTNPDVADVARDLAGELRERGAAVVVGAPGRTLAELVEQVRAAALDRTTGV